MSTWLLIIAFGVLVIVPCWKAVIAAMLLEKSPELWVKWEHKEMEKRRRRDAVIGKMVNGALWIAGWIEEKLKGRKS
jgi:hypothetical protein